MRTSNGRLWQFHTFEDESHGDVPATLILRTPPRRAPSKMSDEQEIRHPTYGTLEDLLKVIAADVRDGYELRMGLHAALSWFANEYGKRRVPKSERER